MSKQQKPAGEPVPAAVRAEKLRTSFRQALEEIIDELDVAMPLDPLTGICSECGCDAADGPPIAYETSGGSLVCECCAKDWCEMRAGSHLEALATRFCAVTIDPKEIPPFDHRARYAPTPEEYEAGCRDAYTENSLRALIRHHGTNYDVLCSVLDREDAFDRAAWGAIRDRINELVEPLVEHAIDRGVEDLDADVASDDGSAAQ